MLRWIVPMEQEDVTILVDTTSPGYKFICWVLNWVACMRSFCLLDESICFNLQLHWSGRKRNFQFTIDRFVKRSTTTRLQAFTNGIVIVGLDKVIECLPYCHCVISACGAWRRARRAWRNILKLTPYLWRFHRCRTFRS